MVLSYYFTNIPPDRNVKDLWPLLLPLGEVCEIFIPLKKNKSNNRYGFARFKSVQDGELLLSKLNDIWIGSFKLRFNYAMERECAADSKIVSLSSVQKISAAPKGLDAHHVVPNKPLKRNFRDLFVSPTVTVQQPLSAAPVATNFPASQASIPGVPNFISTPSSSSWLDSCLMGEVKNFKAVQNLQSLIEIENVGTCKVCRLGGLSILLICDTAAEKERLLSLSKDWFLEWMTWIDNWDVTKLPNRRLVWLRCYGLPLHIWTEPIIRQLGSRWGIALEVCTSTLNKSILEYGRILVSSSVQDFILNSSDVIVDGVKSNIRWIEELEGGVPVVSSRPPDWSDSSYSYFDLESNVLDNMLSNSLSSDLLSDCGGLEDLLAKGDWDANDDHVRIEMEELKNFVSPPSMANNIFGGSPLDVLGTKQLGAVDRIEHEVVDGVDGSLEAVVAVDGCCEVNNSICCVDQEMCCKESNLDLSNDDYLHSFDSRNGTINSKPFDSPCSGFKEIININISDININLSPTSAPVSSVKCSSSDSMSRSSKPLSEIKLCVPAYSPTNENGRNIHHEPGIGKCTSRKQSAKEWLKKINALDVEDDEIDDFNDENIKAFGKKVGLLF